MSNEAKRPLLEAKNLKMYFNLKRKGFLHAVDDVSFEIHDGETLGLVGESGCGKSTIGNVVMRLLKATEGELLFEGVDIFKAKGEESQNIRKDMQIIFQDPFSSLNPKKTIRQILSEPYQIQKMGSKAEIDARVNELCKVVDIPPSLLDHYPHELDGGMRQVVGIARALSLQPKLVVCDEPVSSLDVSVQAKIINLLMDIQKNRGLSYLFISHDLSVVRHISNRIAVMYAGDIIEVGDVNEIFYQPCHPYTWALLSSLPQLGIKGEDL